MATSSQARPAIVTAAVGGRTTSTTSESFAGWHDLKIDNFLATKDLGVGKSIKSSTFRVGGYAWYIECYPCGDHEDSAGWVYLELCIQEEHLGSSRFSGDCRFTLMGSLTHGGRHTLHGEWENYDIPWRSWLMKRDELESLLKDDCFQVRCIVIINEYPTVPQPDLATVTMAGSHSHFLTVNGYSKIRGAHDVGEALVSEFCFAEHRWRIGLYPCGEKEDKTSSISAYICLDKSESFYSSEEVKVRFEMTLLTLAGQIISSTQDIYTFSKSNDRYCCEFLYTMEPETSPLIQHGIKIRSDMAIVDGVTAVEPPPERPDLHRHFGDLLASQVGTDVTFVVGGDRFSAHKCVLATRSTAFMAKFFGPDGKEKAGVSQVLHIYDMEPRVFKALLHFIYTDALPEEHDEEDKVVIVQGLVVAADRYAMERLKLICADMLCNYVNDGRTAVDTLELADKHGCRRLKETCIKFLKQYHYAKVVTP